MNALQANNIWRENMKYRVSRETAFRPKILAALKEMIRTAGINEIQGTVFFDTTGLQQVLTQLYTDAGRVMGGRAYQQVRKQAATQQKGLMPIGYNEQLVNEIIAYFQEHLLEKAVLPITETMKAWVLKYVIDQQLTGKSLQMVIDEMINHNFTKQRAQVIARTEVLKAANYGAVQGAKKTGYNLMKQWISAQDFRTRRIPRDEFDHLAMNGVQAKMDEPFKIRRKSGVVEEMMQPGDPNGSAADVIQCRCTVGFEIIK